ncbi:MAG: 6-carboxytetrahydropterin synthase [Planctomycetota bacterium]
MYEITVHAEFAAAHAIAIVGALEPLHGHNWRITARIQAQTLDTDGLVCDFHTVHHTLLDIIEPFHNNNLNEQPPFNAGVNPTAELVAHHIAKELHERLDEALAPNARLASVSVTEAPGCVATYTPEPGELERDLPKHDVLKPGQT